jgi:hypothetical protein
MIRWTRFAPIFALATVVGCAGQGDIDRTQPDKVDKSIFFNKDGTKKVFYFRQTVTGVPPQTGYSFEGLQGPLYKVRFDIQENYLLAYQAYDYAPGTQNAFTGGANNDDVAIAVFAISSQFDVKREYNASTGEQNNVISENTTDRPWYQRQYMRVDWSKNLTPDPGSVVPQMYDGILTTSLAPTAYFVSEGDISNPDRPVVTPGYIDITSKFQATPDFNTCYGVYNAVFDDGGGACNSTEIKIRNSFLEVKPSTYEPLEFPDRVPYLDDTGKQVRTVYNNGKLYPCTPEVLTKLGPLGYSEDDCSIASADMFSKFGFFRTVRQSWDRDYGLTEYGRKYYANRWNIWKETKDAQGNTLPYSQRKTTQLVYYTNVEWPDDSELLDAANFLMGQWNDAFKKTVAGLLLTETSGGAPVAMADIDAKAKTLDDIVILRPNSCSIANVQSHVGKYADLAKLVKQVAGVDASKLDKTNLMQVCSSLEASTQKLDDKDAKKFTWQRNGDLRYSFYYWVDRPQAAGPLGYGPSSADPETGEIISGTLYDYGANLDTYTQSAVDTVMLLNGGLSTDDIVTGKTIQDVVRATQQDRARRNAQQITPEMRAMAMLKAGDPNDKNRLVKLAPFASSAKFEALAGSDIEKNLLINSDILAAFGVRPGDAVDDSMLKKASPSSWMTSRAVAHHAGRTQMLAMNGCAYMAEFADDAVLGLALELQGLPQDELFRKLRKSIFQGLSEHEIGHTFGLRHNFSGSNDPLNYHDDYWTIRGQFPDSTDPAKQADADTSRAKAKMREFQLSSVMEYGAKFNSDIHGLGKYDYAAIRFGYGQLVDVLSDRARVDGGTLNYYANYEDFRTLPSVVGGADVLAEIRVQPYKTITDGLRQAYLGLTPATGGYPTSIERPYKFCSDEFAGNLDCKMWDEGADQTEIVNNVIDQFRNYYFFNAFRRGRITWSINSYLSRLLDRYFSHYSEAFQFYYFYAPYFQGAYISDDLLKASAQGLNHLGEILQTPAPGVHCVTEENPNLYVVPTGGKNTCKDDPINKAMTIDVGDGKPYYIDFSNDYYYRITRAGSLYEKLAGLIALTSTEARFFRVDTFADADRYSINYYRTFRDQMVNLVDGVIRNDPTVYGGYVDNGTFRSTPVIDFGTYGQRTIAADKMPMYMKAGTPRVDTPVNKTIRYYAMALSFSNLDSTWDNSLDISNYMRVSLDGTDDDITYNLTDNAVPVASVAQFTHPVSRQTYRALRPNTGKSISASLIDELNTIKGDPTVDGVLPTKFGYYNADISGKKTDYEQFPDWNTAKRLVDQAQQWTGRYASLSYTDQQKQSQYNLQVQVLQVVEQMMGSRVDALNDLRTFHRAFAETK